MGDAKRNWVPTNHSRSLSGRRGCDTRPELELRRSLHALGCRYRLQQRVGPGITADLVFQTRRVAVFVDGCFWHGCPQHGKRTFSGPNADRWIAKIARNKARDRKTVSSVRGLGWAVVRLWECDILADPAGAARSIAMLLNTRPG